MATVIRKMLDCAVQPPSEFNKYEAIDILETLWDNQDEKCEFYHLVYQTARGKVDLPKEHFPALVLCLVGDKDHTNVYHSREEGLAAGSVAKICYSSMSRDKTSALLNLPLRNEQKEEEYKYL